MAASNIEFLPVDESSKAEYLDTFCVSLLPLAEQELEFVVPQFPTTRARVEYCLSTLDDGYFVKNNCGILALAGRKIMCKNGVLMSFLYVNTTKLIERYVRDYVVAARRFVDMMKKDSDLLVFSFLEDYDRARDMARRLGFVKVAEIEHNGRKIITKTLRCDNGLDR